MMAISGTIHIADTAHLSLIAASGVEQVKIMNARVKEEFYDEVKMNVRLKSRCQGVDTTA
jgi:hypothetical protein